MNIKELAKEARLTESNNDGIRIEHGYWVEELTRFAALVAAHEREECAKMVDHILKEGGGTYGDAIRARGTR
jgi:hypothetical protein